MLTLQQGWASWYKGYNDGLSGMAKRYDTPVYVKGWEYGTEVRTSKSTELEILRARKQAAEKGADEFTQDLIDEAEKALKEERLASKARLAATLQSIAHVGRVRT